MHYFNGKAGRNEEKMSCMGGFDGYNNHFVEAAQAIQAVRRVKKFAGRPKNDNKQSLQSFGLG